MKLYAWCARRASESRDRTKSLLTCELLSQVQQVEVAREMMRWELLQHQEEEGACKTKYPTKEEGQE